MTLNQIKDKITTVLKTPKEALRQISMEIENNKTYADALEQLYNTATDNPNKVVSNFHILKQIK